MALATPDTSTQRYQEKRELLLGAAATLFNERGVKGTTLGDIAAAVGLVTNSVTYYYRKKEDLATACFERAIATVEQLAVAASHDAADVPDRVHAFFRSFAEHLAAIEAGRAPPLLTFSDIRALPSPQVDAIFAAYTQMFRHVRELLRGPQTEALSRDDLNARGHILLSVLHWLRGWLPRYDVESYTRVAARVGDVLLHGLPSAASAWSPSSTDDDTLAQGDGGALDAFLRAATVLVNEQGYRGASVDRISARLNVTKGSFYHHNDNKDDLITACFERSFAVTRRALQQAETGAGSGWQRVSAAACALVRYQLSAHGPLLRVTATSALPDEAHRQQVQLTTDHLAERFGNLLVDGMVDGSVRALDPSIAAQALLAAINAAAELHRWLPGARAHNVVELYVRPALAGVLCAASSGP